MKNKIGWCNTTWNPIHGCFNNCEYCYARKNAKRFWRIRAIREMEYVSDEFYARDKCSLETFERGTENVSEKLEKFHPVFLHHLFNKRFPQKTQKIFVGSMSEIHYWEQRWMKVVLGRILCYPQHTFIFLTKHPEVYRHYSFSKNCWLGITITDNKYYSFEYQKFKISNPNNLKFICFEPLLESRYTISINLEGIDWVILGAESGNRKGKILPGLDPVLAIFRYCQKNKIPVYVKDNLGRPDVPFDFCRGYKEFPRL